MDFKDYVAQQQGKKKEENKGTQTAGNSSGGFADYVRQKEGIPAPVEIPIPQAGRTAIPQANQGGNTSNVARSAAAASAGLSRASGSAGASALERLAQQAARARELERLALGARADRDVRQAVDTALRLRNGSWSDVEAVRRENNPIYQGMLSDRARSQMDISSKARETVRDAARANAGIEKPYQTALLNQAQKIASRTAQKTAGTRTPEKRMSQIARELENREGVQGPFLDEHGNWSASDPRAQALQTEQFDLAAQAASHAGELNVPKAATMFDYGDFSDADIRAYRKYVSQNENMGWLANVPGMEYPAFDRDLQSYAERTNGWAKVTGTEADKSELESVPQSVLWNDLMTDREYQAALYMYNTQGMMGYLDFVDSIRDVLRQRERQRNTDIAEEIANHPGAGTVMGVLMNLANETAAGAYTAGQALKAAGATGRGIIEGDVTPTNLASYFAARYHVDPNNRAFDAGIMRDIMRSADAARVGEWAGDRLAGLKSTAVGQWAMNKGVDLSDVGAGVAVFMYNGINSAADSAANRLLFGGLGGNASSAVMGLGAMADSTRETLENGGTEEQALLKGAIAGGLEMWTESKQFEDIRGLFGRLTKGNKGDVTQSVVKTILKNMGDEASEEIASEIGNMIADTVIMGDQSEWEQKVREYMSQGDNRDIAAIKAFGDMALQVAEAGAGGAFGGLLGSGEAGVGSLFYRVANHAAYSDLKKMQSEYSSDAAQVFKAGYDSETMAPQEYKAAFDALYEAGKTGMTSAQVYSALPDVVAAVGNETADAIIRQGEIDGMKSQAAPEVTGAKKADEQIAQAQARAAEAEARLNGEDVEESGEGVEVSQAEDVEAAAPAVEERRERTAQEIVAEAGLTEQMREAEAGRTVSEMPSVTRTEAQEYTEAARPGVVRAYGDRQLTQAQEAQVRVLDAIGRRYGVEYEFVETIDEGSSNAVYTPGGTRIKVALDAVEGAIVQAGAHELVHYLRTEDESGYQAVRRIVLDRLNENGVDLEKDVAHRIYVYARHGENLSRDLAEEEIVAEAIPQVFGTKEVIDELVESDRNLAQKIADWIRDFVSEIRETIAGYAQDQNREEIKALMDDADALDEIWQAFDAALGRVSEKRTARETRQAEAGTRERAPMRVVSAAGSAAETEQKAAKTQQTAAKAEQAVSEEYEADEDDGRYYASSDMTDEELRGARERHEDERARAQAEHEDSDVIEREQGASLRADAEMSDEADDGGWKDDGYSFEERYSRKEPVEKRGELFAVHNIETGNILEMVDMGGFPMPSIAVVKDSMGHSMYGDTSVVFKPGAIDPQADRRNRVYGQDAWTAEFPQVDTEYNLKAAKKLITRLQDLSGRIDSNFRARLDSLTYELQYDVSSGASSRNYDDVIERAKNNDGMKAAYLEDTGRHFEPVMMEKNKGYRPERREQYERILDRVGLSMSDIYKMNYTDMLDAFRDAIEESFPGAQKSNIRLENLMKQVINYGADKESGFPSAVEFDSYASRDALDAQIDDAQYDKWVRDLYEGVFGEKWVRNEKDLFTPSGNRRSFRQTHDEYNLQNIVKAMRARGAKNAVGGFHGATGIMAAASEEFESLDAIRERSDQLERLTDEEYSRRVSELDRRIVDAIERIRTETGTSYNSDGIGDVMQDAAKGQLNVAAVKRVFAKEGMKLTDATAQEIVDICRDARNMPTGYFEAKPERAIGLDEVAAVIVPDNLSAAAYDRLVGAGLRVVPYEAGNEQSRLLALNSIMDARFSKKEVNDKVGVDRSNVYAREYVYGYGADAAFFTGAEDGKRRVDRSAYGQLARARVTLQNTAKRLIREYGSTISEAELTRQLSTLTEIIAVNGASDGTLQAATDIAKRVIERGQLKNTKPPYETEDVVHTLKHSKIRLSDEQKRHIRHDWGTLRAYKKAVGRVFNISGESGLPVETLWQEWVDSTHHYIDEGVINPESMLDMLPSIAEELFPEFIPNWQAMEMDPNTLAVYLGIEIQEIALAKVSMAAKMHEEVAKGRKEKEIFVKEYGALLDQVAGLDAQRQKAEEKAGTLNEENEALRKEVTELSRKLEKTAAYSSTQAAKASESMAQMAERLKAHYQDQVRRERERIRAKRRQAFDDIAAELKAADAAGDKDAAKEAMKRYRALLKRVEANNAERAATTAMNDLARRQRREAFENVAARLKAADAAGDRQAQADAMRDYRTLLKKVDATEAEAAMRIAAQHSTEDDHRRAAAFRRIQKRAQALRQTLAKPDKKTHIPQELQGDVLRVLDSMDFRRNGRDTAGTLAWRQSLQAIGNFLSRQLQAQTSGDGDNDLWMTLCQESVDRFNEAVEYLTNAGQNVPIPQMTTEEIENFSNALAILNHAINSINETYVNERYATIDKLGQATVDQMRKLNDKKIREGTLLSGIDNLLNVDNLDAGSFFERLGGQGGAAYTVFEELRKGQDRAYENLRQAAEAVPGMLGLDGKNKGKRLKEIRGWAEEKHKFTVHGIYDGKIRDIEVEMSGTQLMEMYALSRREQGKKHLLTGGFKVEDNRGKAGNRTIKIDEAMLDRMVNELSADQKKVVDRLQTYLSTVVSEMGNEVTEDMFLFRMFTEDFYWPIRTESGYRRTKSKDGDMLFNALINMGFTKKTQDMVGNPIIIGDALTDFVGHVSQMATYNGLARPMDDFLRWYNYVERDSDGRIAYTGSVKKEIERVIGRKGKLYIENMMNDLNGMGQKAMVSDILPKALSNYKRAAIAAKLRVAIQQPTAILRAGAMINPAYLTAAVRGVGPKTVAEMQEHSPLAWWKGNGNYEIGTGASMRSIVLGMNDTKGETAMEKAGWLAGKMDDIGWATIWQGVKAETAHRHKDLIPGTEAYWQHVRDRFEEICMQTQVVDTVLTRSAAMRSKDTLMQMATSFMSEPTKNYNLIRSALGEFHRAMQSNDKGARAKAAKRLGLGVMGILAAQALNSVMTALFDAFKYYDPEEDDEEGNPIDFMDTFLGNWSEDMIDGINPLSNIPFVKDAYDILRGNEVDRLDMNALSKLVNAANRAMKYWNGNANGFTTWAAVKPMITSVGDLLGLPVSGLVADVELALNIIKPGTTRTYDLSRTTTGAYEQLYRAMASGDIEKAAKLRENMIRGQFGREGVTEAAIDEKLADLLALEDGRVADMWRQRQTGVVTPLKGMKDAIMADGWSDEIVSRAVNRYPEIVKANAKKAYIDATEAGDDEAAARYRDELHDIGVDDETIAGWSEEKEDEVSKTEYFRKENLFAAIRSRGTTAADIQDIRDYLVSQSEAEDPEKSVTSSIKTEFKDEYIEAVEKNPNEAARLKQQLMLAGVSEKDIDGWIYSNKGLYEVIRGGASATEIEEYAAVVKRWSSAADPDKTLASGVASEFKGEYVELVQGNKTREAKELKKRLMACGVSEKTIDGWAPAAEKAEAKETIITYIDKGNTSAAANEIQKMIDDGLATKSSIVTSLNSEYRKRYCELMDAGKTSEAERLVDRLMSLNLKKSNGTNYYSPQWFREQYAKWRDGDKS